ncbi:MAG: class I SAM-dependent DNA methyltransferase [Candidatus Binataceae bacterium]
MPRSIYDFPDIFRRVHMEEPGEIEAEVKFLKRVWLRHMSRPVRRALDIGSGNSPHGQLLLNDGIDVAGIDRSRAMTAAGQRESGEAIRFYRRAIEHFTLPEPLFDAAFFMSETFPIITDNADLVDHLRSVARALRRGALYCVDVDRHDGVEIVKRRTLWRERSVSVGPVVVEIREYHRPITWWSGLQLVYELECRVNFPGKRAFTTRDIIPVRYTIPPMLDLAARASGCFRLIAAYADLSFKRPLGRCYGRWWGVLRRS